MLKSSRSCRPASSRRRGKWSLRRIAILTAGWIFVILGTAGLVLPFLQGFLFLAIGIFLLSLESARARLLRQKLATRYPRLGHWMARAQRTVRGWFGPRRS